MPRASRYLREGHTYHLTHRCHDRRFLLRFVRDRNAYRRWLFEAVRRYGVPVYGYCITSNHVHVIAHVEDRERVGLMMHLAAGVFARQLNRRKQHEGSVWEHPYQCTVIQNGRHLLNCLRYVSLNMVRAGVVPHPGEWRWDGFDELMGRRTRYCILDIEGLLQSLDVGRLADLQQAYIEGIRTALDAGGLRREPAWTEALAVGDRTFVEAVSQEFTTRSEFNYSRVADDSEGWCVRERGPAYDAVSCPKPASKLSHGPDF